MLVAPKPGTPEYKLIGRATQISFVTEDVLAKYPRVAQARCALQSIRRACSVSNTNGPPEPPHRRRARHAHLGRRVYALQRLDGNSFALVGFDEVSRELEAQRRALAEKLELERRAAQELEIAKQVQARLFPQERAAARTLEYCRSLHPGPPGGRRLLRFPQLWGSDRFGLVIGDIAGKGIAGALLMANLQANLRSQCAMALDQPARFLRSVNQLFFENTVSSAYATLFFAEYDDRTGRLRYANCGHLCGFC